MGCRKFLGIIAQVADKIQGPDLTFPFFFVFFASGYYLKEDLASCQMSTPWSLLGFLCVNIMGALSVSGLMSPNLSPIERLENALAAYVLLDVGQMVAQESAISAGLPRSSTWLPKQTHDCLQELCGLTCIQIMGLPGDLAWHPWRSSELPLEHHFGGLRGQFTSHQMRARDFLFADSKKMWQTLKRLKGSPDPHNPDFECPQAPTDEEFVSAATRALSSALQLMACCSQQLGL